MENEIILVLKFLIFPGILFIFVCGLFSNWFDRKLNAIVDKRPATKILQPLWDILKLLAKEDVTANKSSRIILLFLTSLNLLLAFTIAMVIPIYIVEGLVSFDGDLLLILFMLIAIGIAALLIGIVSNNSYTLYGAGKVSMSELALEVPFAISMFIPAILVGSLRIKDSASTGIFGIFGYAFDNNPFFIFPLVLMFVIAVFSSVPLCEKIPFDLPDVEVQAKGGWTAEISGRNLAFIRLSSYIIEFSIAGLIAAMFLGGPFLATDWTANLDFTLAILGREWNLILNFISTLVFLVKMLIVLTLMILTRVFSRKMRIANPSGFLWEWMIPFSVLGVVITVLIASM